jgi:ELP3 family radical SAM enzyme/protein acetyltransferase
METRDIEDLTPSRAILIKNVVYKPSNILKYQTIIIKLLEFKKDNYDKHKPSVFNKLFRKEYDKMSKRNDLDVKKVYLVECYNDMIIKNLLSEDPHFRSLISKTPTRNSSGVNSFAILLSPEPNGKKHSCDHNCYYCPDQSKENGSDVDVARSYILEEPAVARGFQNDWSARRQIFDRFDSLKTQGHVVDKIEIIVEGGTFTNFPEDYLVRFFRDIYYACNTYYSPNKERQRYPLEEEKYFNAFESRIKLIGICIETRPDSLSDDWIILFRRLGVTRIQIGVQHTDDNILKRINRGHTFEQSCQAMKLLKDNCFKVDIHLMPDLPFSDPGSDINMFHTIFKTNAICPDGVKIYPCQTTIYTVIKKWYDEGKYKPYAEEDFDTFVNVIKYALINIPNYVRVSRVTRDFDFKKHVVGGNPYSNLKQFATQKLDKEGKTCVDIRTREIGRNTDYKYDDTCFINVTKYGNPVDGDDYFIEMTSHDNVALFGFIRLRIPRFISENNNKPIFPVLNNMGLIRELHVYNTLVPVGSKYTVDSNDNSSNTSSNTNSNTNTTQHKGIGKLLLKKAEEIAYLSYMDGTAIISGEGVRNYYHRQGYTTKDTFEVSYFTINRGQYDFIINSLVSLILMMIAYFIIILLNIN